MPAIIGQLKGSDLAYRLLHYYNYTYLDLQNIRALPVRSAHARKCLPVSLSPSPCGAAQPAARRSTAWFPLEAHSLQQHRMCSRALSVAGQAAE